jgi:hypothetical protein
MGFSSSVWKASFTHQKVLLIPILLLKPYLNNKHNYNYIIFEPSFILLKIPKEFHILENILFGY